MGENQMKIRYDSDADILYILIKKGNVKDTVEISEDLFIEYDENDNIIGIEIWQAKKNVLKELMEFIKQAIKATAEL